MPEQHSVLSCSGASQWIACPGSVEAQKLFKAKFPTVSDDNPASMWGTSCHSMAEWYLQNPDAAIDDIFMSLDELDLPWPVDEEMYEMAYNFRTYCLGLVIDGAEFATEKRVRVQAVHDVCFGTVDFLTIDFEKLHVEVCDLKTGRNPVYAEDNDQLCMYGQGVREYVKEKYDLDIKTLKLRIFGPRFVNGISEWTVSAKDLDKFCRRASKQAKIALSPNAPRVPGDKQCRWCRAEPDCNARSNQMFDLVAAEFDSFEEAENMTPEDRANWVLRSDAIERFLKKIKVASRAEALAGGKLPKLKLVQGKVSYKPREDAIVKAVGDKAYQDTDRKIKSKTALAKELGRDSDVKLDDLYEKTFGDPLLVPETDGRPEHSIESVEDAFEVVDGSNS